MKLGLSKPELLLLAVLAVGVVFTVIDYRKWYEAEYGRYGQGSTTGQVISPSLPLTNRYQNVLVHFRLAYPDGWKVDENPATSDPKYPPVITKKIEVIRFTGDNGVEFALSAEKITRNLIDEVDSRAKKLVLSREREYIAAGKANLTILTWISGLNTHQAAFTTADGKVMFTLEAVAPTEIWATYEKTFWAMYSSLVHL